MCITENHHKYTHQGYGTDIFPTDSLTNPLQVHQCNIEVSPNQTSYPEKDDIFWETAAWHRDLLILMKWILHSSNYGLHFILGIWKRLFAKYHKLTTVSSAESQGFDVFLEPSNVSFNQGQQARS